jgi:hypothetical protein
MAVIASTKTFSGSPIRQVLTDLTPGKNRPNNNPFGGTLPAFLIPAAIGLIAGAVWGRTSKPNEALLQTQVDKTEAAITKDLALADKAAAEAEAIAAGIEDPRGLSREVAEDIAERKIGLEEWTADLIAEKWDEERDFRDRNRRGQLDIQEERRRGIELENAKKDRELTRDFERDILSAERRDLDANTLQLQNLRVSQALSEAQSFRTTDFVPEFRTPAAPPPARIRAVGPGVRGGIIATR